MSPKPPNPFWRRLYALLSVSLAAFLLSVIATATAFHGFQFGQTAPAGNGSHHASAATGNDLESASEYEHARSATISALADYDAAKARRDDYVAGQLTRAQTAEDYGHAISDKAIREAIEPTSAQPAAVDDRQIADRYRELQRQVTDAQQKCRAALDRQNSAWQRKVQRASDKAIADHTAALQAQTPSIGDGPLRATILWCGLLAVTIGVFVCANATASEKVFQTAADVRQHLELTVLGLLPQGVTPAPRDRPCREPNWVKHCIRSSEFCLLALAAGIAILCISDVQFFTKFLADPVAAVGEQLWC
jgi:hypothetical protein